MALRHRGTRGLGFLPLLLPLLVGGCLEPTQVTVEIATDAPCDVLGGTGIAVGTLATLEQEEYGPTTTACGSAGRVGSIVIVPSGEKRDEFAVRVVGSLDGPIEACLPPAYGPGCIVARRVLRFLPSEPLVLPIMLRESCAGVLCPEDQTCVDGSCRDARCPDPASCEESSLPEGPPPPVLTGLGGSGIDTANGLSLGEDGSVLVTGSFQYGIDLGGGPLESAGAVDGFVASFTSAGLHRWSRRFGAEGIDVGMAVASGRSNRVHVLSAFEGTMDFGGGPLTSRGASDVALSTYSSWGKHLWSLSLGGPLGDSPGDVASDDAGNVYVTGSFAGSLDLGGTKLEGFGRSDAFVAAFAPGGGELLWARALGGAGDDFGIGLAVGAAGEVYVTGRFEEEGTFGGDPLTASSGSDVFVASFSAEGAPRWSRRFGEGNSDIGMDVAVGPGGRVAVTGQLTSSSTLDGFSMPTVGQDAFVVTFDEGGTVVWATTFGGAGSDSARYAAFGADGRLFVSGNAMGPFPLAGEVLGGAGAQNPFMAVFDASGKAVHARALSAGQHANAGALAPDPNGQLHMTGHFAPTLAVGGLKLDSRGADDIFLARLATP